jgi:hypothetical protein
MSFLVSFVLSTLVVVLVIVFVPMGVGFIMTKMENNKNLQIDNQMGVFWLMGLTVIMFFMGVISVGFLSFNFLVWLSKIVQSTFFL